MKVALGQRVLDGPWGGGNNFVRALQQALKDNGQETVFSLSDPDIDIILMLDPRARNPLVTFTPGEILRYVLFRNPRTIVVHRINECDERKATKTMNFKLRVANFCADHTVFIASWLKDLSVWRRDLARSNSVILNGADRKIFNDGGNTPWNGTEPLRLVTHHWGANWLKGFDIYQKLDQMIVESAWRGKIEFSYIGNVPEGFSFHNSTLLSPLSGEELATALRQHHVYVTGSQNEPAGMHHIEGASCGLPLLYRKSGALPEYCAGYGEEFDSVESFMSALQNMIENYSHWKSELCHYEQTAEKMTGKFLHLFDELIEKRDSIVSSRKIWRYPFSILGAQIPL